MRILGAILAGGQASRFGSNKALAPYRGEPLIAHAARALGEQVEAVVVCGGDPVLPGVPHLPDRPKPGLGPLGGLAAALFHADTHGFDAVVSVGCDTPILPADLVEQLCAGGAARYLEAMPLIGWWPSHLSGALDAFLLTDPRRSLRGWAGAAGATALTLPEPIANINTREDLAALPPGEGRG
jgi:molybdopterin-guanine dinucleotide biosynthesis protein A